MRNLQLNISTVGQTIVRQGEQLIVGVEALRLLGAKSLSALNFYASMLALVLRDDVWHGMRATWVKPSARVAHCFAAAIPAEAKQHQRRHPRSCHRTAA